MWYSNFLQVEALAIQLTQREGELIQEKAEVKKLATFLKQVKKDEYKLSFEQKSKHVLKNLNIFWSFWEDS